MIVNFEEITQELSEQEKQLLHILIAGFKKRTINNPIKEPELCKNLNSYLHHREIDVAITGARLRKLVNYIRVNKLLPLIATSNGYFVSYDSEVIQRQIKSLEQRARSIKNCADGLRNFL
jgi:hypothetical protein